MRRQFQCLQRFADHTVKPITTVFWPNGSGESSVIHSFFHRAFSGDLTAKWRKAHMEELLLEMELQAKELNIDTKG